MILKKINKILIPLLFIIACDETIPPNITNPVLSYQEHEMYLYGWYNEKNQINLYWRDYSGCNLYDVSIPEINYQEITDRQTSYYINDINYNPGYCFMAYVSCTDNQNYLDSAIVNTKPIDPIGNIIVYVEAGGYDDSLTFTHSSDLDINKWEFYHYKFNQNEPHTHPHYFDISDPGSGWDKDFDPLGWETNKLDYYIYSKENLDDSFCYVIKAVDDKNYSRNSYIKCSDNYTRNTNNPVQITSISSNLPRRIVIEWEEYTDPDFYQYIIWQSEYQDMPESSMNQLAVIIENEHTIYHDRYNVDDGKRWYYMIEVQNQYGKSEFSEIKSGVTRP